jgi:hypothetical protein
MGTSKKHVDFKSCSVIARPLMKRIMLLIISVLLTVTVSAEGPESQGERNRESRIKAAELVGSLIKPK